MRHYRINDQNPIKTKRLILTPLTAKQLSALEVQEENELLRGALVAMRENVVGDPGFALWYTGWQVSLRHVITSYSIHYTKLYESLGLHRRHLR